MQNDEQKEQAKELETDTARGLVIGDRTYFAPINADGRPFYFNALQTRFLYFLQKFEGNTQKACKAVEQTPEWAAKFFSTRKWREYRNHLLATSSVRNGSIRNWWWNYAMDGAKGFKEWYEANCPLCNEHHEFSVPEAEMFRNDDMKFEAQCRLCQNPMPIEYKSEEFHPTREQVQFFSEIGARIEPKVERRIHELSDETYVFVPPEGEAA
jgi:hypothetical protein